MNKVYIHIASNQFKLALNLLSAALKKRYIISQENNNNNNATATTGVTTTTPVEASSSSSSLGVTDNSSNNSTVDKTRKLSAAPIITSKSNSYDDLSSTSSTTTTDLRTIELSLINNYAVCALYCNQVDIAISSLETYIRLDPIHHMNETLLNNLRGLYELSVPNANIKKRMIEALAIMYGPDDCDLS